MRTQALAARVIKLERRHPELYEPAGLKALSDLDLIRMWQDAEGIAPEQQTDDFQTAAEWVMADFQKDAKPDREGAFRQLLIDCSPLLRTS